MKEFWLVSILTICLAFRGCQNSTKNYEVYFVDRSAVFSLDQKENPLLLVVELTEEGQLSLNRIETGSISDVSLLSEKLKVIFEDREKARTEIREVVIDPQPKVKSEDLEKLIETLVKLKAGPIRVIRNYRS